MHAIVNPILKSTASTYILSLYYTDFNKAQFCTEIKNQLQLCKTAKLLYKKIACHYFIKKTSLRLQLKRNKSEIQYIDLQKLKLRIFSVYFLSSV